MLDILIGYSTLILALFVSLINYKKLEPAWLRLLPLFLLVTLLFQLTAHFYWQWAGKSNHFIFNLYMLVEYGFYMLVCFKAVNKGISKNLIMLSASVFLIVYTYEIFLTGHFYFYNTLTRNSG